MGLKVFATPDPTVDGLGGEGLDAEYDSNDADASQAGYQRAKAYSSVADLLAKIDGILAASPNDCLELIEISAHGNPISCDAVEGAAPATIGTKL